MTPPLISERAFPFRRTPNGGIDETCGMTLRDWFAGQALSGINANHVLAAAIAKDAYDNNERPLIALADMAYAMADAMLKKRGV